MAEPKKTMVCVTVQKNCERLIREGAKLAGDKGLSVVHVVGTGGSVLGGKSDGDALEYLFQISRTYGAEMDMLRSDDVLGTLATFAERNDIDYLVIGAPKQRRHMNVSGSLQEKLPGVKVFVIP